MTLALLLAFLLHPIGLIITLLALLLVGMAVNSAGPITNFGAFTQSTASQMISNTGTYFTTLAAGVTTGTLAANLVTGGGDVYLLSSATTPGTQTTRTAAQLFADAAAQLGLSLTDPAFANGYQYTLTITQIGTNTFTLAGGTGVTITGTATIATNTSRTFVVNLTPTAATFTSIGTGTYS